MQIMHQLELSESQVFVLQEQVRLTRDAKVLRRALGLLNLWRGRSAWDVAAELQVSSRTLYRWVDALNVGMQRAAAGNKDFFPAPDRGGRPRRWEEELDEWLEALLSYCPLHLGYARTGWTLPLLKAHFKRWHGETISVATLRRRLHELGYIWKRARFVLQPDPLRDKKIAEIIEKKRKLSDRHVFLFLDETDILLFPPLRSTWARRGEPAGVELSGLNEKRVIHGAMNASTGHLLLISRDRHQVPDFEVLLRAISNQYRGWHPVLLLDQHPSHMAVQSQALARYFGMDLWWLPKRCPELNPLDTLWGKAKDALLANYQSEDIDEETDHFMSTLLDVSPSVLLKASGLQSDSHWFTKT